MLGKPLRFSSCARTPLADGPLSLDLPGICEASMQTKSGSEPDFLSTPQLPRDADESSEGSNLPGIRTTSAFQHPELCPVTIINTNVPWLKDVQRGTYSVMQWDWPGGVRACGCELISSIFRCWRAAVMPLLFLVARFITHAGGGSFFLQMALIIPSRLFGLNVFNPSLLPNI